MKRSEVLDIIDEVLFDHELPLLQGISKEILSRLEQAGMLPPPSNIINPHRYGDDCFTIEVEYRGKCVSKEFPFEMWESELPQREETGQ